MAGEYGPAASYTGAGMDAALRALVVDRLDASPPGDPTAGALVLAACDGPDALGARLRGEAQAAPEVAVEIASRVGGGIHLNRLSVEGFRGIGPPVEVPLHPYPSLTLVVGSNGSGKSSLAEALELLLTRSNRRWEGPRSEVWKRGWRNLHHQTARIAVELVVDGRPGRTVVERTWADGAALDAGVTRVAGSSLDVAGAAWTRALTLYRPFLPHNELGALWDEGPTRLHDTLAQILGLEDVTAMVAALGAERLRRDQAEKGVKAALAGLRTRLAAVEDERARLCLAATAGRAWDLGALTAALGDGKGVPVAPDAARLAALAALSCPDPAAVTARAAGLRSAGRQLAAAGATDAGRARATASLLRAALGHVRTHGSADCPVCGTAGATGAEWQTATAAEIERLTALAVEVDAVHRLAASEQQLATALLGAAPAALLQGATVEIDTAPLLTAWAAWLDVDVASSPSDRAAHLETAYPALAATTATVRQAAAAELRRREDAWRPCATAVAAWLEAARPVAAGEPLHRSLKAAETWAKAAEQELRAARFAPIAGAVQANWATLRQDSSVSLDGLRLEGAAKSPSRRIALDVSIDGAEGQALGVMSQGELNALALSLFLPRASLPESPFRFMVVDDPVQAMDPSRIDGLARVLERAATTHQVLVFTHDERLPLAVRRLGIEATVLAVTRRERSLVAVTTSLDPVARHLQDAYAVAMDDALPVEAGRVVPLFCRLALEAACGEVMMRRRLARGQPLADIEMVLASANGLTRLLALVLDDDTARHSSVMERVGSRFGETARRVVQRCNKGTHQGDQGDLLLLHEETRALAHRIRAIT